MDDIANLPPTRSAKRALELQPRAKKMGRTRNTWVTKTEYLRSGNGGTTRQMLECQNPAVAAINA